MPDPENLRQDAPEHTSKINKFMFENERKSYRDKGMLLGVIEIGYLLLKVKFFRI